MVDVILDGTGIRSELDLHQALERQLDFGPYYGRNLAALRDRLSNDIERPIHIFWRNAEESRSSLGDELYAKIIRLFARIAEEDASYGWDERFEFSLE
ncbi:barstar family protein [Isoptericola cucumis]|uniref:Barstar (barnase inhibitor) domain-containing protein n=1 Tax=Isoptericola cucumis TaxID=1776856 RepID=A0ABQ2BC46_9MICO|nr:barstar family protein [Isoptericola cucumis]GGI10571.1 hypothetical protein GCM10007368_31900 [Isoptericola cucumis]